MYNLGSLLPCVRIFVYLYYVSLYVYKMKFGLYIVLHSNCAAIYGSETPLDVYSNKQKDP